VIIPFTVLLALAAYAVAATLRDTAAAQRQPARVGARRRQHRVK